jgi:hypothetical protein
MDTKTFVCASSPLGGNPGNPGLAVCGKGEKTNDNIASRWNQH